MTTAYTLTTHDLSLTHDQHLIWLHDIADDTPEPTQVDALVASGDYFGTLATQLDKLAQLLPFDSAEQIELEQTVDTLLYLDRRYAIVPKSRLR